MPDNLFLLMCSKMCFSWCFSA